MDISKYDHIIWDWNGTLFNDVDLCLDIINGILERNSCSRLSKEEYRRIFTFPVRDYYLKAGLDFSKTSFELLGKEFMVHYESRKLESDLFPGTNKILSKINKAGIAQSILSAYSQNTLEEIVKNFNIDEYFIGIAGLDNIYAASKMETGRIWMSKINADKVLLIGDTVHDFEVADEIGADCLLIANGHQESGKLEKCGVPVLNDLSEIKI